MTVLQVISLHPFKLGGFEEYILSFTEKMNEQGQKVIFVFSGEPHPFIKNKLSELETPYYVEPIPKNVFGHFGMLMRLVRLIKSSGADIVQGQFHPHDHLAVLAGFFTGRPSYRTIRTTTNQSGQRLKVSSILKAVISSFLSKSTIAISNAVKKDLVENLHINAKKILVLHNGVNLKKYSPKECDLSIHHELGIDKKAKIVLCIAHARPSKGLEHLINAAPIILKNQDVHFVFCGGGPLEGDMIALAEKLNVAANVHFLGVRNDVQELINNSYLVVMPSLAEAFGLVLLEAMAMEKATVASNVEGIAEIVENDKTGILVPPADPSALAQGITSLLEDPKTAKSMGVLGRKRVEEEFNLEIRVNKEIDIYEQELSEKTLKP